MRFTNRYPHMNLHQAYAGKPPLGPTTTSTADSNTFEAALSTCATPPTTPSAYYSKLRDSDPTYPLDCEEPPKPDTTSGETP